MPGALYWPEQRLAVSSERDRAEQRLAVSSERDRADPPVRDSTLDTPVG